MQIDIKQFKTRKHKIYDKEKLKKAAAIGLLVFLSFLWSSGFYVGSALVYTLLLLFPLSFFKDKIHAMLMIEEGSFIDDSSQINPYTLRLKTDDGELRLNNPFSGVLVVGGAGSGKSASLAKPLLQQFVKTGYTGIIYDYKGDLTKTALTAMEKDSPVDFAVLNLRGEPVNLINPFSRNYIKTSTDAIQSAKTIIQNLSSNYKEDYWTTSAEFVLASIIIYNAHYSAGSLPNTLQLLNSPDDELLERLNSIEESRKFLSNVYSAHTAGASNQVSGVLGTLRNYMNTLNSPEILQHFTADLVDLELNGSTPTILSIIPDPTKMEALRPIVSLVISTCLRKMNTPHHKHPSFAMLDELPTLYIHNLQELPNTARSNRLVTVLMCQDISQIKATYGKYADSILAACQSAFYGRTNSPETADYVSRLFGEDEYLDTSYSQSSKGGTSRSESFKNKRVLPARNMSLLPKGAFAHKCDACSLQDDVNYFYMAADTDTGKRLDKTAYFGDYSLETHKAQYWKLVDVVIEEAPEKPIKAPEKPIEAKTEKQPTKTNQTPLKPKLDEFDDIDALFD